MAGETTGSPGTRPPIGLPVGAFIVPFKQASYGSSDNQLPDVKQIGYLPSDVTVLGFGYLPSDMDTNVSPTLVHKIAVGGTDVVTGLTGAQTGAASFVPCAPFKVTGGQKLVTVVSSTAAATAATGTLDLWALVQK